MSTIEQGTAQFILLIIGIVLTEIPALMLTSPGWGIPAKRILKTSICFGLFLMLPTLFPLYIKATLG